MGRNAEEEEQRRDWTEIKRENKNSNSTFTMHHRGHR